MIEILGTANTGESIRVIIEHVTEPMVGVLPVGAGNTVEEAIIDSSVSEVVALQNEEREEWEYQYENKSNENKRQR